MRYLLVFIVFFAITAKAETPEQIAQDYFDSIKEGGMASITKLMHPEEQVKFKNMLAPIVSQALLEEDSRRAFTVFADPVDPSQLRELTAEEFMRAFFDWLDQRVPQMAQILRNSQIDVIGHVKEGDVSHVVVRLNVTIQGIGIEKLSVISTKDYMGVPKMMLTGDIKQMAQALRQQRR